MLHGSWFCCLRSDGGRPAPRWSCRNGRGRRGKRRCRRTHSRRGRALGALAVSRSVWSASDPSALWFEGSSARTSGPQNAPWASWNLSMERPYSGGPSQSKRKPEPEWYLRAVTQKEEWRQSPGASAQAAARAAKVLHSTLSASLHRTSRLSGPTLSPDQGGMFIAPAAPTYSLRAP